MATTLDISKQMDMAGLALKAKDLDLSGNLDVIGNVAVTGTLSSSGGTLTKGSGVSAMESYASSIVRNGNIIKTSIVVDITGLVSSTTDTDIIGNTGGAASAHLGQLTTALNGTIIAANISCLEAPTGGVADITLYGAVESTGAQDALITSLVETAIFDAGGSWTISSSRGAIGLPSVDSYLYLVNGAAGTPGTYTAGKFLFEFYGYIA